MDFIVGISPIAAVVTLVTAAIVSIRWVIRRARSERGDPEVGRAALTAVTVPHPPTAHGSTDGPVCWFLVRIENSGERVAHDIEWAWTPGEKAGMKPLSDRQYPMLNPGESFELPTSFAADMTDRTQLRLTLVWSDETGKKHCSESWLMPSPYTYYQGTPTFGVRPP